MAEPADFIVLSDETLTMLRELYDSLDRDGDGQLTPNDFANPFNGGMFEKSGNEWGWVSGRVGE